MKIIDLYNMVSNGIQPKRFIYKDREYLYSVEEKEFRSLNQEYRYADAPEYVYLNEEIDLSNLNDEIEVLEEKKIEKLELGQLLQTKKWKRDKKSWEKINELIDEIERIKRNEN